MSSHYNGELHSSHYNGELHYNKELSLDIWWSIFSELDPKDCYIVSQLCKELSNAMKYFLPKDFLDELKSVRTFTHEQDCYKRMIISIKYKKVAFVRFFSQNVQDHHQNWVIAMTTAIESKEWSLILFFKEHLLKFSEYLSFNAGKYIEAAGCSGDQEIIDFIGEWTKEIDPNVFDERLIGFLVFRGACKGGHLHIAKKYPSSHAYDYVWSKVIIKSGRKEIFDYCRENFSHFTMTTFEFAIRTGNLALTEECLVHSPIDTRYWAIKYIIKMGWKDILEQCLEKDDEGMHFIYLTLACQSGHSDLIDFFLRKEASVFYIKYLADSGNVALLKHHIEKACKEDLNTNIYLNILLRAIKKRKREIIRFVFQQEDFKYEKEDLDDCIIGATREGTTDITCFLIHKGANKNLIKDNDEDLIDEEFYMTTSFPIQE